MKKIFGQLALVALIASLTLLGPAVQAQPYKDFEEKVKHKARMFESLVAELNLSPEQEERLGQIRSRHHQRSIQLLKAFKQKHRELKLELQKVDSDEIRIAMLAGEVKRLQAEMVDQRIRGVLAIKQILTPEQFERFQAKTEEMHKKRKAERRGKKAFFDKEGQNEKNW